MGKVVKPADNPFTDAELAGAILWGATFYGFTSRDRYSPYYAPHSEYGRRAIKFEKRLYSPYVHDKRVLRERISYGENSYIVAFTRVVWDGIR